MVDSHGFSPPYDFCLVRALRDLGADVCLVMDDESKTQWRDPDFIPSPKGRVFRTLVQLTKAVSHIRRLLSLRRKVLAGSVQVVHFQWLSLPFIDLIMLKWLKHRVPLVLTLHNTSFFHGTVGGIKSWKYNECLAIFDRIIVHSRYSFERVREARFLPPEKLLIIGHGAFDYYRDLAPVQRSARGHKTHFLFAGNIKPYKGVAYLIEALGILHERCEPDSWSLTVAGSAGMDITALKSRVASLHVEENVTWIPRAVSEREMAAFLKDCDVVVLPYLEIDQSGVLMAAIGMHRAVIASLVGAFPEVVSHGENGLLVPPGDASGLGHAMADLVLKQERSAALGNKMGILAREALSWRVSAGHTIRLYETLVGNGE